MSKTILCAIALTLGTGSVAQETATPNGVLDRRPEAYALTGLTAHVDPETTVENATVLIRDGRIVSVDAGSEVPDGYTAFDLAGRHLYAGLIDVYTGYGLPDPAPPVPFSFSQAEVLESQTPGPFNVNQAIRAQYRAADHFTVNAEQAAAYRKLGFSTALTFMADGIARGAAAIVTLADGADNEVVLDPVAAAMYSFSKGSSAQSYPISPMGAIALLRQTHLDADWYRQLTSTQREMVDRSLDGWLEIQDEPQIFEAGDWLSVLRADEVGDEFGQQYIIKGAGDEYRRAEAIKATGARMILPLDFPEAPDVSDPLASKNVSWTELQHWELAPTNPSVLDAAGVEFALTSGGSDKFWSNLRQAIEHGLTEATALAALTTRPATLIGMDEQLGRIGEGYLASLLVTSGPLFDEDTVIEENWVAGRRHVINDRAEDHRGRYQLTTGSQTFELRVAGKPTKPEATIHAVGAADDDEGRKATVSFDNELVTLSFPPAEKAEPARLSGWIEGHEWQGRGQLADGSWVDWQAVRSGDLAADEPDEDEPADDEDEQIGQVRYPFAPYGRDRMPAAETVLIRNATVWTLEEDGVLDNADVLIRDGQIAAVGQDLSDRGARVIDGTGLHVTPGIIDEHSHIALSGVNDVATNSGMVRMNDVVDSEDVNTYRNLAGGVTAAQLLHGSANPIGGQSALVKMRWGALPREMLIDGADGFIKFALGENVKRSRNPNSIRYPQSRMGVEQVYRDAFAQAREYQQARAEYDSLSRRQRANTPPPRRDLALEAMAEILDEERFITCHSYLQSEINMLMHVADDYDFDVNTFTHILEGYKVADKMAAHGAGASTFADWWAYKWEVRYAIPYNAALMTEAGVVTAINSDSAEMARRLNQEAAKAVKYGGASEIEALKMVTLNPARLLHLDDRMGSIREGKDADLVIWTDHPLSIYARPRTTFVDGRPLFDQDEDRQLRARIAADRGRLLAKAASAAKNGNGKPNGPKPPPQRWQCDSLSGYEYLVDGDVQ